MTHQDMQEELEIRTGAKARDIHELAEMMEDEEDPFLSNPRYGPDYGRR